MICNVVAWLELNNHASLEISRDIKIILQMVGMNLCVCVCYSRILAPTNIVVDKIILPWITNLFLLMKYREPFHSSSLYVEVNIE